MGKGTIRGIIIGSLGITIAPWAVAALIQHLSNIN